MSYKSVNADAARYRALRREEVMVSMTHDGNTGSTPWLEGDELDKCADSLLAATPLEPIIEQAQPDAIRNKHDWVQGPYVTDTVGSGWCVRIDGTNIFADLNQYGCKGRVTFQIARGLASKEEAEAMLAAWLRKKAISVADQAQLGTVSEALESARWRNALVGLCDTDRIDSPEQAIANVKRRMRPMGLTQQPVSGADGLTDAAIEMLAKQYDCHNAPGFKGFARAVAALAQQEPRTDADRAAALIVEKLAEIIPLKDTLKATASGKAMIEYFTSALAQQDDDDGHCRSCQGDFCTAGAECVAMEDTQAPRVVQLTHSKHGTMQINTGILREVANREAGEGTFIDAAGTVWSRPTAYAYAMVCKARDKWQAKAEEARDSALGEAAQALAYRRNLLISQNIVNDIQEGVALYDICIDAVLSLQQNATSTDPDKPKRATPMGELVLQLFDALDEAMRLDKSPTAWKHNPAGTPAQRMEAWQKVHKLRAEIKEFLP